MHLYVRQVLIGTGANLLMLATVDLCLKKVDCF